MPPITEITDEVRELLFNELTGKDAPYEIITENIRGADYRVFKNAPQNLKELYALGMAREGFFPELVTRWFGEQDWPFMVYLDEQITFKEAWQKAARLSWILKDKYSIAKGDRVAISMRNYPEFCLAFMAVTAMGAVAVPLNAWWQSEELIYGIKDSGSRLMFADQERTDRIAPHLDELGLSLIVVRPDNDIPSQAIEFQELMGDSVEDEFPPADVGQDDDAYIMYTSGSTGDPKGVVTTHRAVTNTVMSWEFPGLGLLRLNKDYLDELKPAYKSSCLLTVPLFHVTGLVSMFLSSFRGMRKMVMMYKWDPDDALRLIEKERITQFNGVPSMSWELINSPKFEDYDISSVLSLGGGGAARPPEHVKRLEKKMNRHIASAGYGLTETTAMGTGVAGNDYLAKPSSVGRPTPPLVEVKIVDAKGDTLEPGEIGEICFKSPANLRCYWNDEKATADVFLDGGWIKTGDLGYMDEDNFIFIKDRVKDIIIRGGENIACKEVEDAIYEHPAVLEVAVFGLPEERLGEQVAAVVMTRPDESLTEDELKAYLIERIARFKVPSLIWIQNDPLPRLGTEKIFKRGLREEKRILING